MTARRSLVHIAYLVTIVIKGLAGLLEFCGGVLIVIFGSDGIYSAVLQVIAPDLFEAGHAQSARLAIQGAAALARSPGPLVVFYLFVHGTLKMTITAVLLRGRGRWVFPVASLILLGFIGFFSYDLARHWSNLVLGLALFDTVTLALVANEWRSWKTT